MMIKMDSIDSLWTSALLSDMYKLDTLEFMREKKRKRDGKREKEGDLISKPGNHQKYRRDRNISCCFVLYDDINYL